MLDTQAYQKLFEPSSLPEQNQTACLTAQQRFTATQLRSHFLCYVVYGDNSVYYEGIKISILSFFNQIDTSHRPTIVILSQKPEFFSDWQQQTHLNLINLVLPTTLFALATADNYHYRIKTMGLAYIIQLLNNYQLADKHSKFLFFDSDTYFLTNPLPLYDKINDNQIVMYKKEAKIFTHKKYRNYLYGDANKMGVNGLKNQTIHYINPQNHAKISYRLTDDAHMYSSLIMGVHTNALPYLLQASNLMYPIRALTHARTVEQFCFAEVFKQNFTLVEGKDFVHHFSRRRQKAYVASQLHKFWQNYANDNFEQQCQAITNIRFQRPVWLTLAQAIKRIFKPEPIQ